MTVLVEMAGILGRDLQFSLDDDLTEASHGVTSKGGHFFFFLPAVEEGTGVIVCPLGARWNAVLCLLPFCSLQTKKESAKDLWCGLVDRA